MNKQLIAQRFSKSVATYTREASVQKRIAGKMAHLLQQYLPKRPYRQVVEFGCGTGTYSRMLLQSIHPEHLLLNDICPEMGLNCRDLLNERVSFHAGDAEMISFPKNTELITSCSTLQWFESPEEFFKRCNETLNSHGYFAFSTFGKDNMKEIRQLTGNGLPYRSLSELKTSLAPLFHIIHAEEEMVSLNFEAPIQVLHHLKQTGVTGIVNYTWTRSKLNNFCQNYERLFSSGKGSVSLTYHPIYIIAKKK